MPILGAVADLADFTPYCPKTRLQQDVLVIKQLEAFGTGNSDVFSELRSRQYVEMDVFKLLLVSLAGWMKRQQQEVVMFRNSIAA